MNNLITRVVDGVTYVFLYSAIVACNGSDGHSGPTGQDGGRISDADADSDTDTDADADTGFVSEEDTTDGVYPYPESETLKLVNNWYDVLVSVL